LSGPGADLVFNFFSTRKTALMLKSTELSFTPSGTIYVCFVKALEVIKSALKDSWVRTGRRYSLLLRSKKICQSTAVRKSPQRHSLLHHFAADYMNDVSDPHSVIIVITFLFLNFIY